MGKVLVLHTVNLTLIPEITHGILIFVRSGLEHRARVLYIEPREPCQVWPPNQPTKQTNNQFVGSSAIVQQVKHLFLGDWQELALWEPLERALSPLSPAAGENYFC